MQLTDEQKKKLDDMDTRVVTEVIDAYVEELRDEAINGDIELEAAKAAIMKLRDLRGKFVNRRSQKKQPQFV